MCGMIGSAQGWHEAGYLTGTGGVDELAAGAVNVPDSELALYIIPGIKGVSADGIMMSCAAKKPYWQGGWAI